MPSITRRDFLKISVRAMLGLSGLLGLGGLIRFLSFKPAPPPPQRFDLGPGEKYPLGSSTTLKNIPAELTHTEQGFRALNLTCPHLGCTVESRSDGFVCPCHGSRYDKQGGLLKGPAERGLALLRVEETSSGNLIIYKG